MTATRFAPRFLALVLILCGALGACTVGPDYRRPAAPTPAAFKETEGWVPARPSDAADRRDWWTVFGDPVLNGLETRVESSNQTLAAAEAAYRQARASVREQRAALFPTVSLGGAANAAGGGFAKRRREPVDAEGDGGGDGGHHPSGDDVGGPVDAWARRM